MASYGQFDEPLEDFESREAGDKKVYVKFYYKPVPDEEKSTQEGRPCFKDREYVEIRSPGNQTNIINRPVTDMDRQRFRQSYQMFKSGESEQLNGTPLTEVPWITRSQVEELSYVRIRTLEHLANVGDDVCSRMTGLHKLKQRAIVALEQSEKSAPFLAMQAQLDEMKNLIETQNNTINDQSSIIKKLQAQVPTK